MVKQCLGLLGWNGRLFLEDGLGQTQAWMPTYVSILRIPQMIWVWRATVEWYWQGKFGEKPVPVPLCPPQIPQGLTRPRTRASAVRCRRLTTWSMSRPPCGLTRGEDGGSIFLKKNGIYLNVGGCLQFHAELTCPGNQWTARSTGSL
jgi:hypothetical protein